MGKFRTHLTTALELLKKARHELWKALSGEDEVSWVSHLALAVLGTFPFAFIAGWIWGSPQRVLVGFGLSEAWFVFFACREVVDYMKWLRDPTHAKRSRKVRDGIGDLAGPLLNHIFWWGALILPILAHGAAQ